MFAKYLLLAPYQWVLAYISTQTYSGEDITLRQLVLELILLGRLPATEIYLSFNELVIIAILALWFIGITMLYKLAHTQMPTKDIFHSF